MNYIVLDCDPFIRVSPLKDKHILYIENGYYQRHLICPTKPAAEEIAKLWMETYIYENCCETNEIYYLN